MLQENIGGELKMMGLLLGAANQRLHFLSPTLLSKCLELYLDAIVFDCQRTGYNNIN